jgi:hypothetical protein
LTACTHCRSASRNTAPCCSLGGPPPLEASLTLALALARAPSVSSSSSSPLAQVDEEVQTLRADIMRIGGCDENGVWTVKYGVLFDDEKVEQYYEALMGTLKAAKKKGIIEFKVRQRACAASRWPDVKHSLLFVSCHVPSRAARSGARGGACA